jgi:hypothetical protein
VDPVGGVVEPAGLVGILEAVWPYVAALVGGILGYGKLVQKVNGLGERVDRDIKRVDEDSHAHGERLSALEGRAGEVGTLGVQLGTIDKRLERIESLLDRKTTWRGGGT